VHADFDKAIAFVYTGGRRIQRGALPRDTKAVYFLMKKNVVSVFCGSSDGTNPLYSQAARMLGELMASQGRTLIFGGCRSGLMRTVSSAVADGGGRVVAAAVQGLCDPADERFAAQTCRFPTVQARKLFMIDRADACVALPGGIGTLDELMDVYATQQIKRTDKPAGVLNINGYYDPLLRFFEKMRAEGFLDSRYDGMFIVRQTAEDLLNALDEWDGPRF